MAPQNKKHPQLNLSPIEYVQVINGEESVYWERLPTYLISRCPLCGAEYTGKIDPHSLRGWNGGSYEPGYQHFYSEEHEQVACDHCLRVQMFVNQEGFIPSELWNYYNEMFVPFIIPWFVPDDIPSIAVIHSFAICRIEDEIGRVYDYKTNSFAEPLATIEALLSEDHYYREERSIEDRSIVDTYTLEKARFVPRYTAYAIVYYAENHKTIIQQRIKSQEADMKEDPEYWPWLMPAQGWLDEPEVHDLPYWVKRGKLQWLDLESPDLPLKASPVKDFPYINIYRELKTTRLRGWIQG